jgi:tRNA(Ile)-lysidine synthase
LLKENISPALVALQRLCVVAAPGRGVRYLHCMARRKDVVAEIRAAVRGSLAPGEERYLLAVSGGCDSMVLLDAAVATLGSRVAAAATFDHGTGPHSAAAARLVEAHAARLGIRAVTGGGSGERIEATEAAWRAARWKFLHATARSAGARCVTAHSRDDQVETVLMRILRGSGARGLAGLRAPGPVRRPLLSVSRERLREYARVARVPYVDDPTNTDRGYLRNRVRLDLLPALTRVRPGIADELLSLAQRATAVRLALDEAARSLSRLQFHEGLDVAAPDVAGYSRESLAALWPAMIARVGLAIDRRGTERVAGFTIRSRPGSRVQLSGGWEVRRARDVFEVRRSRDASREPAVHALRGIVRLGDWRFAPGRERAGDPWTAVLPVEARCVVRVWQPGDRMVPAGSTSPRRVKRFLSDARIVGPDRAAWPVVVADGEVIWIPGVRRGDAATNRSGRPGIAYECERDIR